MNEELIKLPEFFEGVGEVKGFTFTRVFEDEKYYVYEVNPGSSRIHYELIRRKSQPLCLDFGNRIYSDTIRKEGYPGSKKFGIDAWTLPSLEIALEKIENNETRLL